LNEVEDIQLQLFYDYKKDIKSKYDSGIWKFISLVWESPCQLAITTIQDLLELDKEARFNSPGTQEGNWQWRIQDLADLKKPLNVLKELNNVNERISD